MKWLFFTKLLYKGTCALLISLEKLLAQKWKRRIDDWYKLRTINRISIKRQNLLLRNRKMHNLLLKISNGKSTQTNNLEGGTFTVLSDATKLDYLINSDVWRICMMHKIVNKLEMYWENMLCKPTINYGAWRVIDVVIVIQKPLSEFPFNISYGNETGQYHAATDWPQDVTDLSLTCFH